VFHHLHHLCHAPHPPRGSLSKHQWTKLLTFYTTTAPHPHAMIHYHSSDMVLHIHSDSSYLSASQARSRIGGFFKTDNHGYSNHLFGHACKVWPRDSHRSKCPSDVRRLLPFSLGYIRIPKYYIASDSTLSCGERCSTAWCSCIIDNIFSLDSCPTTYSV
jgi:hypothetical protein